MTDSYFGVYIKHINSDMMKLDMAWEGLVIAVLFMCCLAWCCKNSCPNLSQFSPTSMLQNFWAVASTTSKSEYVHPRVDNTINGTGCFVIDDSSPDNLICNAYKDPFGNVYKDPL